MELIWTSFLLGLVGSVHCAVMCGPLVIAVSATRVRMPFGLARWIYHGGRLTTYCAIGMLFGAVGKTFALAGSQRWVSVGAGIAILVGLLLSSRATLKTPSGVLVMKLKTTFARLLQRRTLAAQFSLGALNGLLPCGLVYIAAAGAATTLSPAFGALHMATFGLGTLPLLLGVSLFGGKLRLYTTHARKLISVSLVLVAMLLIVRGMGWGIPYLSPGLNEQAPAACH